MAEEAPSEFERQKRYFQRPLIVVFIALAQLILCTGFWQSIKPVLVELSSIDLLKGLGAILLGAPYAFFLWCFRNYDKQRSMDIELRKTELEILAHDIEKLKIVHEKELEILEQKHTEEKERLENDKRQMENILNEKLRSLSKGQEQSRSLRNEPPSFDDSNLVIKPAQPTKNPIVEPPWKPLS